jgi:hypothetical protein
VKKVAGWFGIAVLSAAIFSSSFQFARFHVERHNDLVQSIKQRRPLSMTVAATAEVNKQIRDLEYLQDWWRDLGEAEMTVFFWSVL